MRLTFKGNLLIVVTKISPLKIIKNQQIPMKFSLYLPVFHRSTPYFTVFRRIPPYSRAIEAGITIFQEIGLDPGIDHLLAMECFDNVQKEGGKVGLFSL